MKAIRATFAFDGERFLPGGATVMIDDGLIAGVENLAFDLPHDCPVAAYEGTVLPRLFDAHVHLVSDAGLGSLERAGGMSAAELDDVITQSLRDQVAAGVTTVRDLGDVGYRTLHFRDQLADGVPRIVASGPPLTLPDGHCHFLGGGVGSPDEIRASIHEHSDRGVDVIKVMASGGMLTLGTDVFGIQFAARDLRILVDVAHEADLQVLAHAHSLAGIEHALDAGVDGIEHFSGLTPNGMRVPEEVLARAAAAGVVVDLTLGFDRAVVASMPEPPPGIAAAFARLGLDFDTAYRARLAIAADVRKHGIEVVSGVDAGAAPTKRHGTVVFALRDLVAAGYTVAETLATATSGAARACGLRTLTGRLAPGLAADLLVVPGELGTDLAALERPLEVLVRGQPSAA